jgi:phenylacetic acid degradation operon negative regulatory protein
MRAAFELALCLLAFGGEITGRGARAVYARVSKKGRIDRALHQLETTGAVTITGDGPIDQRVIRLTQPGRLEILGGVDPVAAWARPWDGVWRVVAFDIPESAAALRIRLRRRLHQHRFGWLQNSVWITPDSLVDFQAGLDESNIAPDSLTYFEARCAGGESPAALVRAAWDFDSLARSYRDYERILHARPSVDFGTQAAWLRWLQSEHRAWSLLTRRDPFLPEVLLPADYRGRAAWALRANAYAEYANVALAALPP